jgi:hypothetical protein
MIVDVKLSIKNSRPFCSGFCLSTLKITLTIIHGAKSLRCDNKRRSENKEMMLKAEN